MSGKSIVNGVLNINKESGMTSSDVVAIVRKILDTRAVGHMGTLDPQGQGVLLIGVGKGTKLFDHLLGKDKVYEATFCFGYETDTLDKDGTVTHVSDVRPALSEITDKLSSFVGELDQLPPQYSAKNVDGKRAYDLARQGILVDLKPSKVTVYDFVLLGQTDTSEYKFRIHCSSGTYIRSLCRDLAESLGAKATMTSITRTRAGSFDIISAITLDQLRELGQAALLTVPSCLGDLPRVDIPEQFEEDLFHGRKIYDLPQMGRFALYCRGELYGIAQNIDGVLKIVTYLREQSITTKQEDLTESITTD